MSKIAKQQDIDLQVMPIRMADRVNPDSSNGVRSGQGANPSGINDPIHLPELVRYEISKVDRNTSGSIRLVMVQEEECFPRFHSDKSLLGEFLGLLMRNHGGCGENGETIFIRMERTARFQRVTSANTMFFTGTGEVTSPIARLGTETFRMFHIARELGCEVRTLEGTADTFATQITIPINGKISAPDPSLLESEIVHIRKAANCDAAINPIPRMNQTGK